MGILSEPRTPIRSPTLPSSFFDNRDVLKLAIPAPVKEPKPATLTQKFVDSLKDLQAYRNGKAVSIDGQSLSIAAVTATSRYGAPVQLSDAPDVRKRVNKSRFAISDKVDRGLSVYGVSTGFGGSADTRTDLPIALGHSLLQMQHSGVIPSSDKPLDTLPLLDPMGSTTMPEAWVRGAILVRMNSLIRGHSGVRWELIEKMKELLDANIIPVVPVRGSISASGDLQPLSYIAGALVGNPSIRVFDGDKRAGHRTMVSSAKALKDHGIEPLSLASKEPLGILNGTAFSAAVGSLALNDAVHLTLLAQVCTAMAVETLKGTRASFDPFIHKVARPHPGQIESADIIWRLLEDSKFAQLHEEEMTIEEDDGTLRQDRYSLRTAPQFLGPQVEDLVASLETITRECNSTTDNPLSDGETGEVHHGGNFQAMAVTNAMEKTRLSLHHVGKLMFAQCAELVDPVMNRGLPPSLAATDPSLNYHGKGIDIATAAYVAELGYLANPVSTHIQSAEMHNQAVNSLALISARATLNSLETLSILIASYLYLICQAYDLRALQEEFNAGVITILDEELHSRFAQNLSRQDLASLTSRIVKEVLASLDETTTMDAAARMVKVAASTSTILIDFFTQCCFAPDSTMNVGTALALIPSFRASIASRMTSLIDELRRAYLSGARGPAPASKYLKHTRPLYEFVRLKLGVRMHGSENFNLFANGHGFDESTTGERVTLIYEAIRDGEMHEIVASML